RREDDRFRLEQSESAALSIIGESADDAVSVLEQGQHRAFHVHIDSLMDAVVLQGSNHLEPGAVADVSQSRVLVPAEVPLKYAAIGGAIEDCSPRFELTHSRRRFPGVKLSHSPVVDVLAPAHRVGEMDLPVVALVYIG